MLSGAGRTERDLELLGLTLTNQEIVVFPDVLQDRLVHLVAATLTDVQKMTPASEITATSVVPPPM